MKRSLWCALGAGMAVGMAVGTMAFRRSGRTCVSRAMQSMGSTVDDAWDSVKRAVR